ncbi:MAG TPA: hypothetical protein VIV06_10160, partial [Candidatus Limnocylindrales bacterium]
IVELTPVSMRPYIGGSTTNSALELLLGYDGLGRIFGFLGIDGGPGPGQAAGGAGGGFGGTPGLLRMFNNQFGGQVGWLIPLAVVGLAVGLLLHRRAARTDPGRAAYVLWGGWLLVHGAVFSFMSGITHSYYAVVMAPAIGALVGAGVIELWRLRERARFGGFVLAAAAVSTAVWGAALLARTPDFAPGAGIAALVAVAAAGLVLALPAVRVPRRLSLAAGAIAIAALLVGPTAYAADTMATAASGGDPAAGPVVAGSFGDGGPGGGTPSATGGGTPSATDGGLRRDGAPPAGAGNPPSGPMGPGSGASAGGGLAGGMGGGSIDQSVVDYLLANRGTSTWLVAVRGSSEAARIQLSTGMPVMAMGGFNGGDDAPTLEQLRSYVASGQLRFVLVGGVGGPDGQSASGTSSIDSWVTSSCLAVDAASGGNLYDCAAAASAGG